MYKWLCAMLWCLGAAATSAQGMDADIAWGGHLSLQWDGRQAGEFAPSAANGTSAQAEISARGRNWSALATLLQKNLAGTGGQGQAWFNELVYTHDAGAWQYSVGKKIVAWDVGYAFRPNDVVQQEERHSLIGNTAQGRPVLMAERFDSDSAWSLVLVNPSADVQRTDAGEPALALRYYQRQGALDWHGFARVADRTGPSIGIAAAWVASDALELHASLRHVALPESPLRQGLVGATWTSATQLSLLAEAWWDGKALAALRRNLYARVSMEQGAWQPALDVLYYPDDHSRILSAILSWKGDRLQVQAGVRALGTAQRSWLAYLPLQRQATVQARWSF